jgi:hypothetical protein
MFTLFCTRHYEIIATCSEGRESTPSIVSELFYLI